MKIIDITRVVQEAPIYPGSDAVIIEKLTDTAAGDMYNSSKITAGSHMGTHADAFSHFLADSDITIEKMPLDCYCGKCVVISVPENTLVKLEDIQGKIFGAERIVLHGGGNTYLCEEAAEYIASCHVKVVVTDAWSVAPLDNEANVHGILFAGGTAVVENVVLDGVEDGEYLLFAFPIKYAGCDGAPVRAVLVQGDEV